MKVTDIRIRKTMAQGKMKAVVSISLDDVFAVHDIRIIQGTNREFVAMPSRKTPEGEYRDIAHPINPEFRAELEALILERYHREMEEKEEPKTDATTAVVVEEKEQEDSAGAEKTE